MRPEMPDCGDEKGAGKRVVGAGPGGEMHELRMRTGKGVWRRGLEANGTVGVEINALI